jgi:hypothetical protein
MFLRSGVFFIVAFFVSNVPLCAADKDKKKLLPLEESFMKQAITLVGEGYDAFLTITYTSGQKRSANRMRLRTLVPETTKTTSTYFFNHALTLFLQRKRLKADAYRNGGELRDAILEDPEMKRYWCTMLGSLAQQNPLVKNIKGFEPFFPQETDTKALESMRPSLVSSNESELLAGSNIQPISGKKRKRDLTDSVSVQEDTTQSYFYGDDSSIELNDMYSGDPKYTLNGVFNIGGIQAPNYHDNDKESFKDAFLKLGNDLNKRKEIQKAL